MSNHTPGPWATDIETAAAIIESEGAAPHNRLRDALERISNGGGIAAKIAREALREEDGDSRINQASIFVNHGSGKGGELFALRHDPGDQLDITDAETIANARLAASSPDLLAALESVVTQANGDLSDAEFRRYARDVIAQPALDKLA